VTGEEFLHEQMPATVVFFRLKPSLVLFEFGPLVKRTSLGVESFPTVRKSGSPL